MHDAIGHIASLQNKLPACCPHGAQAKKAGSAAVPHKDPAVVGAQGQRGLPASERMVVSRVRATSILSNRRGADDRGLAWLPWRHLNLTGALFLPLGLPVDTGLRVSNTHTALIEYSF